VKTDVKFVHDKGMKEKEVRENIERATAVARDIAAQRGKDIPHEQMRDVMIKHAERDKQRGKI
jgi:hypothetical protein